MKFQNILILLCLLALAVLGQKNEDDVDGFDDSGSSILVKKGLGEISATNLNPFQVEVFVSYCAA